MPISGGRYSTWRKYQIQSPEAGAYLEISKNSKKVNAARVKRRVVGGEVTSCKALKIIEITLAFLLNWSVQSRGVTCSHLCFLKDCSGY